MTFAESRCVCTREELLEAAAAGQEYEPPQALPSSIEFRGDLYIGNQHRDRELRWIEPPDDTPVIDMGPIPPFAAQRAERLEAEARARQLLLEHLTEQQATEIKAFGSFLVRGGHSGDWYRIGCSIPANIRNITTGQAFCIVAEDIDIPMSDVLLAQAMLIQHDEEQFLAKANRSVDGLWYEPSGELLGPSDLLREIQR